MADGGARSYRILSLYITSRRRQTETSSRPIVEQLLRRKGEEGGRERRGEREREEGSGGWMNGIGLQRIDEHYSPSEILCVSHAHSQEDARV